MARRIWSPVLETLALFLFVFAVQGLAYVVGAASLVVGLFVLRLPIEVQPWTVVTSVYAHGSLGHLVSNAVGLLVFGWPIARATTRIRFTPSSSSPARSPGSVRSSPPAAARRPASSVPAAPSSR